MCKIETIFMTLFQQKGISISRYGTDPPPQVLLFPKVQNAREWRIAMELPLLRSLLLLHIPLAFLCRGGGWGFTNRPKYCISRGWGAWGAFTNMCNSATSHLFLQIISCVFISSIGRLQWLDKSLMMSNLECGLQIIFF